MPSISPQYPLPGVKIRQFFPLAVSTVAPPAFAATLIGPARTVVYGEQGILGGTFFNTTAPFTNPQRAHWEVTVTWPRGNGTSLTTTGAAMTIAFADASLSATGSGDVTGIPTPVQPTAASNPDGGVDYLIGQLVSALRAAPIASSLIGDIYYGPASYGALNTDPQTRKLIIMASSQAINTGVLPQFQVRGCVAPATGVASVTITAGGTGYTSAPTVAFTGGGGSGAAGTATFAAGAVTGVTITTPGTGYTTPPTVTFTGGGGTGATGTAVLNAVTPAVNGTSTSAIASIQVTAGGTGYTSAPTVVFTGGGGSGATATASFSGGAVTSITLTAPGSGYTSAPAISFTGGGGSGATATALMNVQVANNFFADLGTAPTMPALASNWSSIQAQPIPNQVVAGIEVDKERFHYFGTVRQRAALDQYLALTAQSQAFAQDLAFIKAGTTGTQTAAITISKVPLDGSQRLVAYSLKTGVEYELKYTADALVVNKDWDLSTARTGGAFQSGDSINLYPTGDVLSTLATHDLVIRALYIPQRQIAPLPLLRYRALLPTGSDVYVPAPVTSFNFTGTGNAVLNVFHSDKPQAARMTYTTVARVTDSLTSRYQDINLAPILTKTITKNATGSVNVVIPYSTLNSPNIDETSIVVRSTAGTALVLNTDYTIQTGVSITLLSTGAAVQSVNNPVSITYRYSPFVTTVGTPTITWAGTVTAPTYVSIGGGRYRVSLPMAAAAEIGSFTLSATIEYPVEPEIQLEFIAERSDLDGTLYTFAALTDITGSATLADTYAGQTIPPDLTSANPSLHAATFALGAANAPIFYGVGDMTTLRSAKILQILEAQFSAYHIVPISMDGDSIFTLVGAHIDKLVATLSNDQIHFNAGALRCVYGTFDQRNALQLMPLTVDTLSNASAAVFGRLVPGTSGGLAVQADMTQLTGVLSGVSPGDYVEFLQYNCSSLTTVTGSTALRAAPKRLQITSVDNSTPTAVKLNVTDVSLPAVLGATEFHLQRGAPFRIVRVRDDFSLASDIKNKASGIGAALNGKRRRVRQPDYVFLNDSGVTRKLPGFYGSVIEASIRAAALPHQGLTRYPLPYLTGVSHNVGTYSSDDVIAIMMDGGCDYKVQRSSSAPVVSVKELTADRTNQDTASPIVNQIADFASLAFYATVDRFIGTTNVFEGTQEAIAAACQSLFDQLKRLGVGSRLGPMILSGAVTKLEVLPTTSANAGYKITITINTAHALEQLNLDVYVNQTAAAATV